LIRNKSEHLPSGDQGESVVYRIQNFLDKLRLEMAATHLRCEGQNVGPERISCVTIGTLKAIELTGTGGRGVQRC